MSDAASPDVVSAVMAELASRRWRGQVATRYARVLAERLDELPPTERRALAAALNEYAKLEGDKGE
jgi:hypothetical protein